MTDHSRGFTRVRGAIIQSGVVPRIGLGLLLLAGCGSGDDQGLRLNSDEPAGGSAGASIANAGAAVVAGSMGATVASGGTTAGASGAAGRPSISNSTGGGGGAGGTANAGGSQSSAAGRSNPGAGVAGNAVDQGGGGSPNMSAGGSPNNTAGGADSAGGAGGSGQPGNNMQGGMSGMGDIAGMGGMGGMAAGTACPDWPTATGDESLSQTRTVSGTFDGELRRYVGTGALGTNGQQENQEPLFIVQAGGTLKNVIVGNPAADGIHCEGDCTLQNVWWEDVGEDAATLKGSSDSQTMTVDCGGARGADDKVFQHNGPGTFVVKNFTVENFGKLYRSCGNCRQQFTRHAVFSDIVASGGSVLAGVNENYDDTAEFERITMIDPQRRMRICDRYQGNSTGAEPTRTGSGPDSSHCLYEDSDITWQ